MKFCSSCHPGEDKHLLAFREFSDSAAIPSKAKLHGEVEIRDDIKKIQMSGLGQGVLGCFLLQCPIGKVRLLRDM